MFAKLLKYEWKAVSKLLGLLSLGALGVGILGGILLRALVNVDGENTGAAVATMGMMMFVLMLTLLAYGIGSEFMLLRRFYKNKFTDEGYLTFTLPASASQIFLSSLVNTVIWMTIISVVLMVSFGILFGIGYGEAFAATYSEMKVIYNEIGRAFEESGLDAAIPLQILYMVVASVSSSAVILTCITAGATFAKKHKIICAIAMYYGVSMVKSFVNTFLSVANLMASSAESAVVMMYLVQTVVEVLLGVGCYFLSMHLMKNELNLP